MNILYKIVIKFIYKDSKTKKKTAILKCSFLTWLKKTDAKKP